MRDCECRSFSRPGCWRQSWAMPATASGSARLVSEAEGVFTLPLTREERAAVRAGQAPGSGPADRLAAWLVGRSHHLLILRGQGGAPARAFATSVVERCDGLAPSRPGLVLEVKVSASSPVGRVR